MVTLEARTPCPICGCFLRCHAFPSVRVNRRSIRQLDGPYLRTNPGPCPECGFDTGMREGYRAAAVSTFLATRYRLTADSAAEVEAYRARRWPERQAS